MERREGDDEDRKDDMKRAFRAEGFEDMVSKIYACIKQYKYTVTLYKGHA